MVQTLGVNESRDIYLGADGNIVLLSGIAAVESACLSATRGQLGEMVLQAGLGLPNFQAVWVGVPDFALWESYLRNTLQNVNGVTEVTTINISVNNNTLSFTASIKTIYGSTTLNG